MNLFAQCGKEKHIGAFTLLIIAAYFAIQNPFVSAADQKVGWPDSPPSPPPSQQTYTPACTLARTQASIVTPNLCMQTVDYAQLLLDLQQYQPELPRFLLDQGVSVQGDRSRLDRVVWKMMHGTLVGCMVGW